MWTRISAFDFAWFSPQVLQDASKWCRDAMSHCFLTTASFRTLLLEIREEDVIMCLACVCHVMYFRWAGCLSFGQSGLHDFWNLMGRWSSIHSTKHFFNIVNILIYVCLKFHTHYYHYTVLLDLNYQVLVEKKLVFVLTNYWFLM